MIALLPSKIEFFNQARFLKEGEVKICLEHAPTGPTVAFPPLPQGEGRGEGIKKLLQYNPISRFPNKTISPSSKLGSVLIVVMWIAMGLVSVALLFGRSMLLENRAAENVLAGAQAEQAIEGAIQYIQFVLNNAESGEFPDVNSYTNEWAIVGDSTFWIIGRGGQIEYEYPSFGLIDEASKLNLNTATVEMLEKLPNMSTQLAASIIDWRDEDDELTGEGAESQTYSLRSPSYTSKNAPFETLSELHWVYGAQWEWLYGEDQNRNGLLDWNEQDGSESPPIDNRDSQLDSGLLEYLTVYSKETNLNREGEEEIYINEEDSEELEQLLIDTFGEERANEIQEQLGPGQQEYTSLLSFFLASEMEADELSQIADSITASEEVQEGLINVNTASAIVLACIPGLDEDKANQLVEYRETHSDSLDTIAWVAEVLDEESANEAGEYLTTNSFQFSADIAAVGRDGKGFRRTMVVFDTSEEKAMVRYRRDLTRYGWALGQRIRQELAVYKEQNRVRSQIIP